MEKMFFKISIFIFFEAEKYKMKKCLSLRQEIMLTGSRIM